MLLRFINTYARYNQVRTRQKHCVQQRQKFKSSRVFRLSFELIFYTLPTLTVKSKLNPIVVQKISALYCSYYVFSTIDDSLDF